MVSDSFGDAVYSVCVLSSHTGACEPDDATGKLGPGGGAGAMGWALTGAANNKHATTPTKDLITWMIQKTRTQSP